MDTSTENYRTLMTDKNRKQAIHVRINNEARVLLSDLAKMANKKELGHKIKQHEIVLLGLGLIQPLHLKELQEKSLSNTDRMELAYRQHAETYGKISKDEFIGKLMCGEINTQECSRLQ